MIRNTQMYFEDESLDSLQRVSSISIEWESLNHLSERTA